MKPITLLLAALLIVCQGNAQAQEKPHPADAVKRLPSNMLADQEAEFVREIHAGPARLPVEPKPVMSTAAAPASTMLEDLQRMKEKAVFPGPAKARPMPLPKEPK